MSPSPQLGPVRFTDASWAAFQPGTSFDDRRLLGRTPSVKNQDAPCRRAGSGCESGNLGDLARPWASKRCLSCRPAAAFTDSDCCKWLSRRLDAADPLLEKSSGSTDDYVAQTCTMLSETQADDGYLNSYHQVLFPGRRFADCGGVMSCTAPAT